MSVIFSASSDSHSTQHSSRIIEPLVRWFFPHISAQVLYRIDFVVRKIAHLSEYAVLAILSWRAFRKPARNDSRPWTWGPAAKALLFVALYAASDEWHQSFVPNRQASIVDVMIDTVGAGLGILLLWGAWTLQQRFTKTRNAITNK